MTTSSRPRKTCSTRAIDQVLKVYCLKKLAICFVVISAVFSSTCFAEWKPAAKKNGFTVYIDDKTRQVKKQATFVWAMYDFDETQPEGYRSVKVMFEVECKLNRYRFRMFTAFEQSMGNGEAGAPRSSEIWESATPDSIGAEVVRKVCSAAP
jgi:hypothetical protein